MNEKRTLLQTYSGPDFGLDIEKWWIPIPNSPIESYVGVALIFRDHVDEEEQILVNGLPPSSKDKAVLLSKERTKALIESLQKAIGEIK